MPRLFHAAFCVCCTCVALASGTPQVAAQPAAPPVSPSPAQVAASGAKAPTVPTQPMQVGVTVRDAQGQPVAGAELVLLLRGDVTSSRLLGRTDAQGRYPLALDVPVERGAAIDAGFGVTSDGLKSAAVLIYAAGYAPVRAALGPQTPTVTLQKGITASGLVRDLKGQPVAGALVRADSLALPDEGDGLLLLNNVRPESFPPQTTGAGAFTTRTDAGGHWTLRDLPPAGRVGVRLADPRFATASLDLELGTTPPEQMVLKAKPGARLSGRLLYPDGQPVRGVSVLALIGENPATSAEEARTDAEGRFSIIGMLAGNAQLTADAPSPDWAPLAAQTVTLKLGQETRVPDLKLSRGVALSGRVLDEQTRLPLPGARVSARGSGGDTYSTRTDAQGRYSMHAIPGETSLAVNSYPAGYVAGRQYRTTFNVTATNRTVPNLTLRQGATLTGTALDEAGQPAVGVVIIAGVNGPFGPRAIVDAKGQWTLRGLAREEPLPGLPPQRVRLRAGGNWALVGPSSFGLDPAPINLRVRPIARTDVTARVVDTEGQPVAGAKITAKVALYQGSYRYLRFVSDARGEFVLRKLPPDTRIELSATKPGYTQLQAGTVTLGALKSGPKGEAKGDTNAKSPQGDARQTNIVLSSLSASVTGRVVDAKGQPVAGALVAALGYEGILQPDAPTAQNATSDGDAPDENTDSPNTQTTLKPVPLSRIATTDAQGRFTLRGVRAGEMRVGAAFGQMFGVATTVVKAASTAAKATIAAKIATPASPDAPVLTVALGPSVAPLAPASWDIGFAYFAVQNPPDKNWEYTWHDEFIALLAHDPERAMPLVGERGGQNPGRVLAGAFMQLAEQDPALAAKWGRPYLDKETIPEQKHRNALAFALHTLDQEPQLARQTYDLYAANVEATQLTPANANDFAYLAALAARLNDPDAEGWAQALSLAVAQMTGNDYDFGIVGYGTALAEGSPALAQKFIEGLPLRDQPLVWEGAIPVIARRDPAAALQALTTMETLVARPDLPAEAPPADEGFYRASPKQALSTTYGQSARALLKTDPIAAYNVARKMDPKDFYTITTRVSAAVVLPREAALSALRETFEVAQKDNFNPAAAMARVAAATLPLDAALGEDYFDAARARLYPRDSNTLESGTQGFGVEHFALFRAASNPAEARLLLENEWQRLTALLSTPESPADNSGLRSRQFSQLYRLIVAMGALDQTRAEALLNEAALLAHDKPGQENYEALQARTRLFRWMIDTPAQRLDMTLY